MKVGFLKWLLSAAVAGAFLCISYTSVSAANVADLINTIITKGSTYACSKGKDIRKPTVRSFNGMFCSDKRVAAFAMKHCAGIDGFETSHCHDIAQKVLGKTEPQAVLDEAKKTGDPLAKAEEQAAE